MVWDCAIASGSTVTPHSGQMVNAGSFSPDLKTFLSAGQKGRQTLVSWDVERMAVTGVLEDGAPNDFVSRFSSAVSPDGFLHSLRSVRMPCERVSAESTGALRNRHCRLSCD